MCSNSHEILYHTTAVSIVNITPNRHGYTIKLLYENTASVYVRNRIIEIENWVEDLLINQLSTKQYVKDNDSSIYINT